MLAIAACQGETDRSTINPALTSSSPTDCQTVRHEIRETKICGQPHRIVVLGTHLLESLLVLGVQPVGFADLLLPLEANPVPQPELNCPPKSQSLSALPRLHQAALQHHRAKHLHSIL
jgi:iron complex transport system substrate-binding protein